MRTKRIYQGIALLAVALATAACQNELNEESSEPKPGEKITMTIRATQGTTPQTRTSYEDKLGVGTTGNVVVKWEGGTAADAPVEQIKVFGYANNGDKFTDCGTLSSTPSTLNTDGTSITFAGTATQAENYIAIYPVDNCILEADGSLSFNFLNQTQDCTAGKEMAHLKKYDIMKGVPTTGTNNYTFTHQSIMLRFDLILPTGKTEIINNVTLATSIQDGMGTGMSMMIMGENLPWYETNSISLAVENHTKSNQLKAYMMIPSIDLTEAATLTITVATASGNNYEGKLTTGADTKLEAGLCYTLTPTLTLSNIVTVPPVTEGGLKTELDKITSLDPKQTELVVTGTVNDADLTALGTFLKDTKAQNITTLDLSGIIGTTEVKGLAACTKITTVVLPDEATAIGDNAFEGCTALTTVIQKETAPAANTRASMPSRVKTVGKEAFKNCTSMTEMFLHANITSVGNNAFDGCTAMTTLVFEGTKSVGSETANLKLGTDIVANTNADLKIFLPAITDDATATTYYTALEKPIYYNFAGYGSAATGDKVKPTNYTLLPHGNGIDGLTPGGEWGSSTKSL